MIIYLWTNSRKVRVTRVIFISMKPITDELIGLVIIHTMGQTDQHLGILVRQVITRTSIWPFNRFQR